MNTMANMNDRYMEEYEAARSGRPSIQETLTKAQEQERKKKRHRYEKIGAALLVLIGDVYPKNWTHIN